MSRRRRTVAAAAAAMALGLGAGAIAAPTWSSFSDTASNPVNAIASAPDWRPPTAGASAVLKSEGGTPGYVRAGGAYTVLAAVTDSGNPASGVAGVTADAAALTAGQTAVALGAGSFSAGGVAYNRSTASLTAGAGLAEGAKAYSLTSTDVAGNTGLQTGFGVTVDNTRPAAADVQTADNGGTVGRPQAGDTITFTFSEPIDPGSVLAGWSGASTDVVVRITDGGCLLFLCNNDSLTVRNGANTAALPLGTVDLKRPDYRGGSVLQVLTLSPIDFGRSTSPAPRSSMAMSGATLTVTLGTPSDTTDTASGNGTMTWAPASAPYDRAANALTTSSVNESGGGDREF